MVISHHRSYVHRGTPFKLTFGCEAVVPVERNIPSYRMRMEDAEINEEIRKEELTLAEEVREVASSRKKKPRSDKLKVIISKSFQGNSKSEISCFAKLTSGIKTLIKGNKPRIGKDLTESTSSQELEHTESKPSEA